MIQGSKAHTMSVHEYMKRCDEIAALWNKTKDPKRKEEWYELVKKLADRLAQEYVFFQVL